MRVAPVVELTELDREWLRKQARSGVASRRLGERCRIVLLAAEGNTNEQVAEKMSVSRHKAGRWRMRFAQSGRAGIEADAPGRGRKPIYPPELRQLVVQKTTQATPPDATHWSLASMAKALDLSPRTVGRIWQEHGLKPHLIRTFKVSNDPHFAEKLEDVIGLYLHAPEHAIVLCVDEKSQVQALDRTQPGLPLKRGRASTLTHDYVRHGTTTLFAALNVADGKVIGHCQARHRHQEWLKFLQLIDAQTPPGRDLHLILDNYATHKHPKVKAWLAKHPRFHLTPTSASWLNLVERFFGLLTQKALKRGSHTSIHQLRAAILAYVDAHNERRTPFKWVKTADEILDKMRRFGLRVQQVYGQ